jgi:transposase
MARCGAIFENDWILDRIGVSLIGMARRAIIEQIAHYDRQLFTIARHHQAVARLMTVPGVGPVTAIAFAARRSTIRPGFAVPGRSAPTS